MIFREETEDAFAEIKEQRNSRKGVPQTGSVGRNSVRKNCHIERNRRRKEPPHSVVRHAI